MAKLTLYLDLRLRLFVLLSNHKKLYGVVWIG